MSKRVKFTEAQAIRIMSALHDKGIISGWNITKSGYVRYHEVAAKVWRDFNSYDLIRWAIA